MKWIMNHITWAALTCIIMISIIILFGNMKYTFADGTQATGFNAILGKDLDTGDQDYSSYQDDDVLQEFLSIPNPVIDYTDTGQTKIKSDTQIQLLNYFNVTFGDGYTYKASELDQVSVLDVIDPGQNSILSDYNYNQKTIVFTSAGIYTIKLYVYDQDNRETTAEIKIPVEEGSL